MRVTTYTMKDEIDVDIEIEKLKMTLDSRLIVSVVNPGKCVTLYYLINLHSSGNPHVRVETAKKIYRQNKPCTATPGANSVL